MKIDNKVFSVFWTVFLIVLVFSASSVLADQRYLVGTGNFNDTAIWSATSGGTGGASVPGSNDDVILDANSSGFIVTLVSNVTIFSLDISDGSFDAASYYLRVRNDVNISGGNLLMGSSTSHIFNTNLNLSGGTLNFGSSTVNLRGNFTILDGNFNSGTSTLVFSNGTADEQILSSNTSVTLYNVTVNQRVPDNEFAGVTFDNNSLNVVVITINGTLNMKYPDQEGIDLTLSGLFLAPILTYGSNSRLLYSGNNPDFKDAQSIGDEFSATVTVNDLEISLGTQDPYPKGVDISGLGDRTLRRNLTLTNGLLTHAETETLSVGGVLSTGTLTTGGSYVGGTILLSGNQTQLIQAGAGTVSNINVSKDNATDVVTLESQILNITGNLDLEQGIFELGPGSNGLSLTSASSLLRVQANGTFRTGGKTISNSGSFDLQSGSTFEFNGTSQQEQTPSGLAFSNLLMNNPGGINVIGHVVVNGNLQFNADNHVIVSGGLNTLTLGPTGTVTGYNSDRFILGPMRKQFTGAGSAVFPIGIEELSDFYLRPATFTYTGGIFGGTSEIRVAYTRASFTPKSLPAGISAVDPTGHYQVTELGTAPTGFTYSFTGTFDDGNFSPESRNHALVETSDSYIIAASNVVDDINNTVNSGDFSVLPVDNNFIVFGAGGTSITWDGGAGDGFWSSPANWNPDAVPTSTDDVVIDDADGTVVTIGSSTAAVAQTLTLGGIYSPTLIVGGSSGNPLRIYQTSGTPLTVNNASLLQITNSQGIKFDPDNTNQYDLNRTDYGANSTVEYQAGLVQADEYGNLIVNGASNSSSGTITVNGNMTKQSSTSFSSAAEVIVNGNYTNTEGDVSYGSGLFLNGSTLTATSGNFINSVVTFTGTSGQTITGSPTATNFFALDISNPNGLTLNKPVNITQTLSLNNGLIITTATNILTLVGSASVSGGNDNSFVYGPLARTSATGSKDFPIGKSVYRPVNTNFSGSSPVVQFEVFDTAPIQNFDPPLELISQVRHWTGIILSGSVSSGSVTLNYGTDDGVQLGDSLRVAYSPDQNTTAYFSIGGSGSSAGSGSITGNLPINSPLGYFTLGSVSLDNSLPVELTTFSAVGKSGKILLSWETASEINNMGFDVVRSEKEAGSYTKINQQMIQGQGNSNTAHFYEFEDVNVAENQRYYYKLYSRDFDGTVHDYGEVVSATVKQLPKNFRLAQNYPNPFNPSTTISIEVAHKSTISLEIYNMLGQKIRTLIDGSRLQPGVYDNIVWDATDDQGNAIANGIYYLVFNAADYNFRQVRKMVFMK